MPSAYSPSTTFSKSPGLAQIFSYVLVLLQAILYYSGIAPRLSTQMGTTIGHALTLFIVVVATILTGFTDPTDQTLRLIAMGDERVEREAHESKSYCEHCSSFVNEDSKHCRVCNRCIERFDHHCMWINNCVGEKNYHYFLVMIISAVLHLLSYIIALSLLTVQADYTAYTPIFALAWSVGVVVIVFLFLLLNLICLHLYLLCKGLTTYEFLMAQKRKNVAETVAKTDQLKPSDSEQNLPNHGISKRLTVKPSRERLERLDIISNNSEQTNNVIFAQTNHDQVKSQNQQEVTSVVQDKNQVKAQIKISRIFLKNKSLKLMLGKSDILSKKKSEENELE